MVSECSYKALNQIGIQFFATSEIKIGGQVKKSPEDFIVNEILQNDIILDENSTLKNMFPEGGLYTWVILEKKGIDTLSAVQIIARVLRISPNQIQHAGLKDAQGITRQVISLWNAPTKGMDNVKINGNIRLKSPTRIPFPVTKEVLKGNNFKIRISGCEQQDDELVQCLNIISRELKTQGILNYYDLQRFGNNRPISHLVGMMLLKGEHEEAARLYLTYTSENEDKYVTNLRKSLRNETISFREFERKIPSKYSIEKALALAFSKKMTNPWDNVDKRVVRLFLSAVQSFFFNQVLSHLVMLHDKSLHEMRKRLPKRLPVMGRGINWDKYPREITETWKDSTSKFNLDTSDLVKPVTRKGGKQKKYGILHFERAWNVIPEGLQAKIDNRNNAIISFSLPRGSYGTIVAREFTKNA